MEMNLQAGTIEKLFLKTAIAFRGDIHPFQPFPKASAREAYKTLPAALKNRLVKMGESRLNYAFPVIRATDYMRFKRDGDRAAFEALYFGKRNALNDLIQAECVEHKGRFLDDIINGIYSICEESAWQLPAHNSYIRDTPQLILPDVTRPVMDLFACETGALLACAAYLLEEEFNAVSPFVLTCIEDNLKRRILQPYLTAHFWWMGHDDEPMCNWTVWCTQNVLLTTFLMPWSEKMSSKLAAPVRALTGDAPLFLPENTSDTVVTLQAILYKAAESCDYFLKDYGNDGCCEEGAQYYRHAGLCLYGAMTVLNTVTGGHFSSLFQWDKVKNIAAYILNVHVDDKYYFNFADCSPIAGRAGVREYLFGKATGQEDLCLFAAKDFQAGQGQLITDEVNGGNLFYRMQTVFYYEELMHRDTSATLPHRDVYYHSVGLFLVHSNTMDLAVKAGDNADSHNHNDTGSVTLYKNGLPVLADIGVETYTQKTFSSRRYEIWTMQSGYHNLPTICGFDEHDGAEYRAQDVTADLTGTNPSISMELATAYPVGEMQAKGTISGVLTYRRTVTLKKPENTVILEDHTNTGDVILNFITYTNPTLQDPAMGTDDDATSAALTGALTVGEATLLWTGAELLAIETLPITDARLKTAWDHDLYRIRLKMSGEDFRLTVK